MYWTKCPAHIPNEGQDLNLKQTIKNKKNQKITKLKDFPSDVTDKTITPFLDVKKKNTFEKISPLVLDSVLSLKLVV